MRTLACKNNVLPGNTSLSDRPSGLDCDSAYINILSFLYLIIAQKLHQFKNSKLKSMSLTKKEENESRFILLFFSLSFLDNSSIIDCSMLLVHSKYSILLCYQNKDN